MGSYYSKPEPTSAPTAAPTSAPTTVPTTAPTTAVYTPAIDSRHTLDPVIIGIACVSIFLLLCVSTLLVHCFKTERLVERDKEEKGDGSDKSSQINVIKKEQIPVYENSQTHRPQPTDNTVIYSDLTDLTENNARIQTVTETTEYATIR